MTVGKAITNYIAHQRCLGKQFSAASAILTAFRRSIGDIPLREVLPETVAHFVDSKGTSDETIRKKLGALANFFRFAVARQWLRSSPMPQRMRKLGSSFTPYIYSDTELKRLFEAIPLACAAHVRRLTKIRCARFCCCRTALACVGAKP
jgi:site-specific recombinase XerD